MGKLRIAVAEGYCEEIDRQSKEECIHGLNESCMLIEIMHKLIVIKDTSELTSKQVLAWARYDEAKRTQTTILDSLSETKDFNGMTS